ncbi:MAG: hypothetical protein WBO77_01055 [Microgenomates group bacterium]
MQENYHGRLFMTGILSLIFILVIILIGVIFVTYRTGNSGTQTTVDTKTINQDSSADAPVPLQSKYKGTFFMHIANDAREFSVGDQIEVEVFADSDGQNIVGYDLDVDITGGAQFASAQSSIEDFDMHPTPREGGVYLTSLKDLASNTPTTLADSQIATIMLTATAPGTVTITPKFILGETRHSNLMSITSESVLSSVEGVTVTVR